MMHAFPVLRADLYSYCCRMRSRKGVCGFGEQCPNFASARTVVEPVQRPDAALHEGGYAKDSERSADLALYIMSGGWGV